MDNLFKPVIIAVGYNRPDSMNRLLKSIGNASYKSQEITLIVSVDKSDKTYEVINVAEKFDWKYGRKIIRTFEKRQGLRNHILQCGDLSKEYGSVIILEDDIVVSPMFYIYTESALNFYRDDDRIAGVALYSHQWNGYATRFYSPVTQGSDVYLAQFSITWGQCWTNSQWTAFRSWYAINIDKLEYSNKILRQITNWPNTSWGKYFVHYIVENSKFYIIPYNSLSTNFSDIGQHARNNDSSHQVPLLYGEKEFRFVTFEKSLKYDIFFENLDLPQFFSNDINKDGICVDLYGTKEFYGNNRYLLTTKKKSYKIVESYGIQMRPHEMNIIYRVPGNDIFLYDLENIKVKNEVKSNYSYSLLKYELRGFNWRQVIPFGLIDLKNYVKRHILK